MNGYAIKQNSAAQPLTFLLVSSSDHISGLTGKAASVVVTISKNAGAPGTPAGAIGEIGNGLYAVAGNGTDSNTLGPLWLHAKDAASDPTDVCFNVVAYDPQVATNLGLLALPTASPGASGGLPTADASNGVKLSVGTGAGQVNAASGKVPATMGSADYAGNTVQTGDSFARIGATGSGLTSLAPASTALSAATWTTARAGYLDNLSGGAVALHSDAASLLTQIGTPMQAGNVTVGGYASGKDPATLVLDAAISGHETAGSVGAAIAAAGGSGDPWATVIPGSYVSGQAGYVLGHNLDAQVSTRSTYAGGAVAGVTAAVTVGTNNDKTGYALSSAGLDSIPVTAPTGPATTFPQMLVQTWRRYFKKVVKATSETTIKTFADDETTVLTTQAYSDDGAGNETLGAAS